MSVGFPDTSQLHLGPDSSGALLTPDEFDAAEFEEGWRYELIHGVLVVSPAALRKERDPNEELGRWLRNYQEDHPHGASLDATFYEETVVTRTERRRADRVIYAGLGRPPREGETPTVVVEFVSAGKRSLLRDYEEKRDEYLALGVREYWIVDPDIERIDRIVGQFIEYARIGQAIRSETVEKRRSPTRNTGASRNFTALGLRETSRASRVLFS